jgi:hypothetical protein
MTIECKWFWAVVGLDNTHSNNNLFRGSNGKDTAFEDPVPAIQTTVKNIVGTKELVVDNFDGNIKGRIQNQRRGEVVGKYIRCEGAFVADISIVTIPEGVLPEDKLPSRVTNGMIGVRGDSKNLEAMLVSHDIVFQYKRAVASCGISVEFDHAVAERRTYRKKVSRLNAKDL